VVFNVLKASADQVPDRLRGANVALGKSGKEAPALCDRDRGIDDCLGRKSMHVTVLDAKYVARQMKRANLPTTIGKELVCPNCALPYLVDVIGRFCLSKDFRALGIFKLAPNRVFAAKLI